MVINKNKRIQNQILYILNLLEILCQELKYILEIKIHKKHLYNFSNNHKKMLKIKMLIKNKDSLVYLFMVILN